MIKTELKEQTILNLVKNLDLQHVKFRTIMNLKKMCCLLQKTGVGV